MAGAAADAVLHRGNGSEPKSLDPHFIDLIPESNIVGDFLVGLTTFDASARPIPGAADRWTMSADGKIWAFHIRNHLWSDGTPVTAHDFVFAWQRLLDPKTGAYYGYNLWLLKNAHAISGGKLPPSALGVHAPDDSTLVVELEHPAPYLPELLTHQTAAPLPRHVLLALGTRWSRPGSYVANGAYLPTEWIANDHITLTRNPRFYDAAHVRIDKVVYYPTQDAQAGLRRYRSGEIDTLTPIPLASIDWIRRNLGSELHSVPFVGLSYIDINLHRRPFNDVRLREALNLAYDRETIAEKILRFGDKPAYSIVPPNVAGFANGPTMAFSRMAYADRIAKARLLMAQLGFGPGNRLHAVYATTGGADNRRIAAVLQALFRQIYVDLEIAVSDDAVHYRTLQQHQFDLASASWFADFNDASNFLDLLRHDSGNNNGGYFNPSFESALDAAQAEPDATKRNSLLFEAESIALQDYPWIPMRFRMTQDLVKPYVKGWIENSRQVNRTRWLWIDQH